MADQQQSPLPDELRCKRSDGRSWRCKRPSLPGKLLCDTHYQKSKHLAAIPVEPISEPKPPRDSPCSPPPASDNDSDADLRVPGREHLDRTKKRKHSWVVDIQDAYSIVDDDDDDNKPRPFNDSGGTKIKRRTRKLKLNAEPTDAKAADEEPKDEPVKRKRKKNKENLEETMNEPAMKKRRRRKKKENIVSPSPASVDVTRELQYGRMAISPPPEPLDEPSAPAAPPVKLGLNPPVGRLVNRRFRSKNVDQPPISTVKAVPYAKIVRDKAQSAGNPGGTNKCHWCRKNPDVSFINCLSCKKRSFCSDCIKGRCIDAQELEKRCIVCRGTCECNSCKTSLEKDAISKAISEKQKKVSEHLSLCYLISLIIPILEQINEVQGVELEMEAKLKGQSLSEVEIQQVEIDEKNQISCNKCNSFILDMHRNCPSCSYNLCLSCCQESRSLMLVDTEHPRKKKSVLGGKVDTEKKQTRKSSLRDGSLGNDSLLCPSLELGGCSKSILHLRCIFPLMYTKELETSAKEMILSKESPDIVDSSLHCALCSATVREGGNKKELLEASKRKHPGDNFLYSPSIHADYKTLLLHFQKHWCNSHPVVVRDLLEKASNMNWDPIALFSYYLKMCLFMSKDHKEENIDSNCMDLYKVEFRSEDCFSATAHSSCEKLTLKAKLSSSLSQRVFADYLAAIVDVLPIQEYTNPGSGFLNLAAKSAEDSQVSEFSPHIYITCGSDEEIRKGKLVAELRYSVHDLVNILVHASDFLWSSDQISQIKSLMKMNTVKDMGGYLDDRMTREHSEITEEAGQPDKNIGSTLLNKEIGAIYNLPAPGSETESGSPMMCSSTSDIPEKPASDKFLVDPIQLSTLKRQHNDTRPSGVEWDVFRRQDAPKLLKYIQKHSDEFFNYSSSKQLADPILDGSFFLDAAHKMRLKDEFKIEPWTFAQNLGEAVIIPAGCPYQTRNLKSCVNVVLGFMSPENAGESIKLSEKHQASSADHNPRPSKVEVQKMAINKIRKAIEELHGEAGK